MSDQEYEYNFAMNEDKEYRVYIESKNNNVIIRTKKTKMYPNESSNRFIAFELNDKLLYSINYNSIKNHNSGKIYSIYKNTIMDKIDEKNYIGYNIDNDKVYLYTKRNDNESVDFDKDYLKVPYSNNLSKATEVGNTILDVSKIK